jgi:hypothetical protein
MVIGVSFGGPHLSLSLSLDHQMIEKLALNAN